jgi:hypothetical protein
MSAFSLTVSYQMVLVTSKFSCLYKFDTINNDRDPHLGLRYLIINFTSKAITFINLISVPLFKWSPI